MKKKDASNKRNWMGVFTIAQEGDGWIVLEDAVRVGGALRDPFASREAAQKYIDAEMAAEAETIARGDVGRSAKARVVRDCDPELWAAVVEIEDEFAHHDDSARHAAHRAAGTFQVLIRLATAALEAEGKICRTGEMRKGQPVFVATVNRQ